MTNEHHTHNHDDNEQAAPMITLSIKTVSSIVTGVVAILGSVWAIDSHYASAADVDKLQRGFQSQVQQIRTEQVEDEMFKLDIKKQSQNGRLDPIDAAMRERYARRLEQAREELRQLTEGMKK